MDSELDASEVRPVLEALGWEGQLTRDTVPREKLRDLVLECPCNAVFDWRGSAGEAVETLEAIVEGLPRGWAKGARSVEAVQRAARRAVPDVLWKAWADNDGSDTAVFLLVRAGVWRELEQSWLPEVLAGGPEEPEPEQPDRGEQTREVAGRVIAGLLDAETLDLVEEAEREVLIDALGRKLRSTYPGEPVLGELLGDWMLGRPEVEELYLDDAALGEHVRTTWNEYLGKAEAFPKGGKPGDIVAIRGLRFRGAQWVRLGGRELSIVGNDPALEVLIPADMEPGLYRFTIASRTGSLIHPDTTFLVPELFH